MIDKTITIEELVNRVPASVRYLMEQGIRCLVCGEPSWGTLESAAREKGMTDERINDIVAELNRLAGTGAEPATARATDRRASSHA